MVAGYEGPNWSIVDYDNPVWIRVTVTPIHTSTGTAPTPYWQCSRGVTWYPVRTSREPIIKLPRSRPWIEKCETRPPRILTNCSAHGIGSKSYRLMRMPIVCSTVDRTHNKRKLSRQTVRRKAGL